MENLKKELYKKLNDEQKASIEKSKIEAYKVFKDIINFEKQHLTLKEIENNLKDRLVLYINNLNISIKNESEFIICFKIMTIEELIKLLNKLSLEQIEDIKFEGQHKQNIVIAEHKKHTNYKLCFNEIANNRYFTIENEVILSSFKVDGVICKSFWYDNKLFIHDIIYNNNITI